MKNLLISCVAISVLCACQPPPIKDVHTQRNAKEILREDTLKIKELFDEAKKDTAFIANVELYFNNPQFKISREESTILIGDLNEDAKQDALVPFTTISTESDGNSEPKSERYYAVFLSEQGKLSWKHNISREYSINRDLQHDEALYIDKIDKGLLYGNFRTATNDKMKPHLIFQWQDWGAIYEGTIVEEYWEYKDLKINAKVLLNASEKELLQAFGKPNRTSTYFSECNYDNGEHQIFHYGTFLFDLFDKKLVNDEYEFSKPSHFYLSYGNFKMDVNLRYEDFVQHYPNMLKHQTEYQISLGDENVNPTTKTVYVPLHKFVPFSAPDFLEYFNQNWLILHFENGYLKKISIPNGNCEI